MVLAFHAAVHDLSDNVLLVLDAAGLSLFAVTGAAKALDYAMNPVSAVLMGVVALSRRARPGVAMACGAAVCFALRIGAIAGRWNLPRAT